MGILLPIFVSHAILHANDVMGLVIHNAQLVKLISFTMLLIMNVLMIVDLEPGKTFQMRDVQPAQVLA